MKNRNRIGTEKVIAVLDGLKASKNEKSVASLKWVFRNLNLCADDELLVLVILNPAVPDAKLCCFGDQQSLTPEEDGYVNFLQEEIGRRREAYLEMLRPFHKKCKLFGAKFEVKVFAGCQKAMIISSEAIRTKATWIVVDRRLMEPGSVQLGNEGCRIVVVNDDAEAELGVDVSIPLCSSDVAHDDLHVEVAGSSVNGFHECNMPDSESDKSPNIGTVVGDEKQQVRNCSKREEMEAREQADVPPVTGPEDYRTPMWDLDDNSPLHVEEGEDQETFVDNQRQSVDSCCIRVEFPALNLPMELNQEDIQITSDYCELEPHPKPYAEIDVLKGILKNSASTPVLIKRFATGLQDFIDAEKRASMLMFHKNILSPIGIFEESSVSCSLVYMYSGEGSLQRFLSGQRGSWQEGLTCSERMRIAIETGTAIRYMHEECPRGPVAHGNIRPCNIYLGQELEPHISDFGQARWLGKDHVVRQERMIERCSDQVVPEEQVDTTVPLLKEDVYSYGVLLLRLFCPRQMPEDDTQLVEWARPLLIQGAFHELLDECMGNMDMYEVYKVMSAASQCTKRKPLSRPTISQVVGILKGSNPCRGSGSPASSDCTLAAWQMR